MEEGKSGPEVDSCLQVLVGGGGGGGKRRILVAENPFSTCDLRKLRQSRVVMSPGRQTPGSGSRVVLVVPRGGVHSLMDQHGHVF